MVCSRSFGVKITEYESLRQAICQHAERASENCVKSTSIAGIFPFHQNVSVRH
ncbi:DinB/UmuC family translesion DNA polymerase [Klebsiella oxytoca]|uniref:DinB/UmuC family translesion DNA polymerase n=1 Tax=Klebsiella oxytoca TaxID=571 RepID=UPI003877A419